MIKSEKENLLEWLFSVPLFLFITFTRFKPFGCLLLFKRIDTMVSWYLACAMRDYLSLEHLLLLHIYIVTVVISLLFDFALPYSAAMKMNKMKMKKKNVLLPWLITISI